MTVYYSQDHEWIQIDGDIVTLGITDYAQQQLGDVVYVDLPEVGAELARGDEAAVVESVKAASEVYAAVSGKVTEINSVLADAPQTVNSDAEGAAWFCKLRCGDPKQLSDDIARLMNKAAYDAHIAGLSDG